MWPHKYFAIDYVNGLDKVGSIIVQNGEKATETTTDREFIVAAEGACLMAGKSIQFATITTTIGEWSRASMKIHIKMV